MKRSISLIAASLLLVGCTRYISEKDDKQIVHDCKLSSRVSGINAQECMIYARLQVIAKQRNVSAEYGIAIGDAIVNKR